MVTTSPASESFRAILSPHRFYANAAYYRTLHFVSVVNTQATPFALITPGCNLKAMPFSWLKK